MDIQRVLLAVAALAVLAACGDSALPNITTPSPVGSTSTNRVVTASGTTVTQPRPVGAFDGVTIGVPGRLTIEPGSANTVTIVGDEAVLSVITSEVDGRQLILGLAPGTDLRLNDPAEIEYRVTVETLHRLDVNGTVLAIAQGIATSRFEVRINGASTVQVFGEADRQDIVMSGSSRYEARGLLSRDAVLDVSGTSFVVVNAQDRLQGQLTGAAIVRYLGTPMVSVAVTGAASLEPE